jgi:hypothetical protein
MELSDKLKGEFDRRAKLVEDTKNSVSGKGYVWSLAVLHLSYVCDYSGFVGSLKEHVGLLEKYTTKYSETAPPDIVVEGDKPDELYVLMYGPKVDAMSALHGFFEALEGLHPGKWIVGARLGVSEYAAKSTADSMIDAARKRPIKYVIGELPVVKSDSGLTGGLEKVT